MQFAPGHIHEALRSVISACDMAGLPESRYILLTNHLDTHSLLLISIGYISMSSLHDLCMKRSEFLWYILYSNSSINLLLWIFIPTQPLFNYLHIIKRNRSWKVDISLHPILPDDFPGLRERVGEGGQIIPYQNICNLCVQTL